MNQRVPERRSIPRICKRNHQVQQIHPFQINKESYYVLVEGQRHLWILDTDHGVIELPVVIPISTLCVS